MDEASENGKNPELEENDDDDDSADLDMPELSDSSNAPAHPFTVRSISGDRKKLPKSKKPTDPDQRFSDADVGDDEDAKRMRLDGGAKSFKRRSRYVNS
jgi:hypothetical protein